MTKLRNAPKLSFLFLGVPALLYGAYLGNLYRDVESRFLQSDEFIPTRIYSDVVRIAAPMPKGLALTRLKGLQYAFREQDNSVLFTLRNIDYPHFLLPDRHPTLEAEGKQVELIFDGPGQNHLLTSIKIEGREGEIAELFLEPELVASLSRASDGENKTEHRIRHNYRFEEFPSEIWKAILAVEDQHFLDHKGIDPRGIARAMWVNIRSRSFSQGGSTITLQLIKNLMARTRRNIFQKISELFLAPALEMRFSKERILERYLNEIYLGQVGSMEVHGVSEGARYYFGKNLTDLNLAEHALLSTLVRGAAYYSPYKHFERAKERQGLILQKMLTAGFITENEYKTAMQTPLRLAPPPNIQNRAPYFTDYVKAELLTVLKDRVTETDLSHAGLRVYTTLDLGLTQATQDIVANHIKDLETRYKLSVETDPGLRLEGAVAAADPQTGFIRVLVGGRDYSRSNFNRVLNMRRQVGSTFKPFVYLAAYGRKDKVGIPYGPAYPMLDGPWTYVFDNGRQKWEPKNYEPEFRGWIPLQEALAHSINTVAGRLAMDVGYDAIIDVARKLGITSDIPRVPSMALGVMEMTPVELLTAYTTLAHRGAYNPLTVVRVVTENDGGIVARFGQPSTQAIDQGLADAITETLTHTLTEGTAKASVQMGWEAQAAGKTGTTSQHRDSWFAGYTSELAAITWVGFDSGVAVTNKGTVKVKLSGAGAALPLWVGLMKRAAADEPPTPFVKSEHMREVRIDRFSGQLARKECPDEQVMTVRYWMSQIPFNETCLSNRPEAPQMSKE